MILINGTEYESTCSHTYLYPESTVYFQVINIPGEGVKRMKVITNNGVEEYSTYTSP
jgi:archaellum component FlaF (FlaF/FlaG flagellin family)